VWLLGATALAQGTDDLLRRGIELRHEGRDEEALAVFARAHEEHPDARSCAQLGLAHQSLGHWLEAERLLREAIGANDPWVRHNQAALEAALLSISRRLGTLEVRGETVGAEVLVDGRSLERLPLAAPTRVVAGVLTIDVRLEGHVAVTRRVVVDPGASVRESIPALTPLPREVAAAPDGSPASVDASVDETNARVAPAPARISLRPPARTRDALAATALALGAAGIAAGVAALAARVQTAEVYNRSCPPAGAAVCEPLAADFDVWTIAAWVALPLGVAATGVGAWLFATRPEAAARGGLASLRCGPWRLAGLGCALRFE